jgi:hypothetical protein
MPRCNVENREGALNGWGARLAKVFAVAAVMLGYCPFVWMNTATFQRSESRQRPAIQNEVRWYRIQLRPETSLRCAQDVKPGATAHLSPLDQHQIRNAAVWRLLPDFSTFCHRKPLMW